ncbi:MAG TPA: hypothetical protein VNN20_01685 [Thermodesulfobacteriota bacterium]|nr:hypothetical protein [Thermodesulfobacteriota bacterium]
MGKSAGLVVFFVMISICYFIPGSISEAGTDTVTGNQEQEVFQAKTNALRSACAYLWDRYYQKEKVEIRVSTRGNYDETVIFTCPDCSLEENFVEPFLNSEYRGKTGMDRIKACGYTQVVFKGARGLQEIVRQVPE